MSEEDEKNFEMGSATDAGQDVDSNENATDDECENKDNTDTEDVANFAAKKIEQLEKEATTLKDTVLRKVAEMENLRKRLEREKNDALKYANKNFAKDLLTVLDNFERAMENIKPLKEKIEADTGLKNFINGIILCEKELLAIFKRYGISQIEANEGDDFNHDFHQAMCEVSDPNHKDGTIMKVFQTGYMYNERLLRPAMVSVSKKS